jgi:hypothetical protein
MPTIARNDDFKIIDHDHSKGKTKPPLNEHEKMNHEKMKKKRGSFSLFKTALTMVRGKKGDKEPTKKIPRTSSAPALANGDWKSLVGSVRPLHLNEIDQSPPPSILRTESLDSFTTTQASPAPSSSTLSQYASVSSLQDLVDSDREDDPDTAFDAITGDEMIDSKADEFIAQFYKQIQIQNTETYYHHHRQRTI